MPNSQSWAFFLCSDSNDARDIEHSEPHTLGFINADFIAADLAQLNAETATFKANLKNFNQHYRYAVYYWILYDNYGVTP